jgi:hypothetical protein
MSESISKTNSKPKKKAKSKSIPKNINCLSCRFCDVDEELQKTFCWLILKIVKDGRKVINKIPCKKYQKKEVEVNYDDLLKDIKDGEAL